MMYLLNTAVNETLAVFAFAPDEYEREHNDPKQDAQTASCARPTRIVFTHLSLLPLSSRNTAMSRSKRRTHASEADGASCAACRYVAGSGRTA